MEGGKTFKRAIPTEKEPPMAKEGQFGFMEDEGSNNIMETEPKRKESLKSWGKAYEDSKNSEIDKESEEELEMSEKQAYIDAILEG